MRYITRDGEAFETPENSRKIGSVFFSCAVGAAIGIGLGLALYMNPGIIAGMLDALKVIGMAIGNMLANRA